MYPVETGRLSEELRERHSSRGRIERGTSALGVYVPTVPSGDALGRRFAARPEQFPWRPSLYRIFLRYNRFLSGVGLRYLILSDIHSNLEAFEKTREMADGKYDKLLCLGDVVGYGPDPNAVIQHLRGISHLIIRGNHDKACAGITDGHDFNRFARLATLWTRKQLNTENLSFLRSLPAGPVILNGFQLVHGSPSNEDQYLLGPAEALSVLKGLPIQVVLFGHTHFQGGFLLTFRGRFSAIRDFEAQDGCVLVLPLEDGNRYLINPGSVGQPRDGDWRAAFAILDEEQKQVEYYRTSYDVSRTQQKMEDAGLPEPLIRRLSYGR